MLKASENPPLIAPGIESLLEVSGPWWVGHTKARAEKKFAGELLRLGVAYFLPMVERTAVWGGRKRKILTPVFASYVFFAGGATARQQALQTDKLCQVIPVSDASRLVHELDAVHRAIQSKHDFWFYPHTAIGQACQVTHGPLRGITGTVVQNDNITRLVLHVSMLGQGAALEISADLLEPIDVEHITSAGKRVPEFGGVR